MPSAISETHLLPLLSPLSHRTKTIDFGASGVSASLSTHGRLVALFTPHPTHGQILVAPWEQFPADRYQDIPFVRKYRALPFDVHNDPSAGFGMSVKDVTSSPITPTWSYSNGSWPHSSSSSTTCHLLSDYFVSDGQIFHQVSCTNVTSSPTSVIVDFSGPFSVHRASYSQLTPQGDLSIPEVENWLRVTPEGELVVFNHHLPATLRCSLYVDGTLQPLNGHKKEITSTRPIFYSSTLECTLDPAETRQFTLVYTFRPGSEIESSPTRIDTAAAFRYAIPSTMGIDIDRLTNCLGGGQRGKNLAYIVLRNVDYLLACCTVPVVGMDGSDKGSCIITDHQCLPLGWNRDNYWQLDLLSSLIDKLPLVASESQVTSLRQRFQQYIRSHLLWAFSTAQRPRGYWARCFYLGGRPKDAVFQLDQQCYPLLELAEYADRFAKKDLSGSGQELDIVRSLARGVVDEVLQCLNDRRWTKPSGSKDENLWLFKTDETPADDAVDYPYHFSSHVLLWRTLRRLADLQTLLADDTIKTPVATWAEKVKAETLRQFVTVNPANGKKMFAYLTSTMGEYQFYHDANDLPTSLAPSWGFCHPESEEWVNTIAYAYSVDNKDGYFPGGAFGGLGSVHTRDPWPLGDGQQLVVLATRGELGIKIKNMVDLTLDKIVKEVQWDGLFSEAVDRFSGKVTSKHWFSWPGAFISSVLLNRQEELFGERIASVASAFASHILKAHQSWSSKKPLFVGLQGPQGAGKTYTTTELKRILESCGLKTVFISTDDLYLTCKELKELAERYPKNSMLVGRGPPGTHDIPLGKAILTNLENMAHTRIPCFDKYAHSGYGDRSSDWSEVKDAVDIVLVEGWSLGFASIRNEELDSVYQGPDHEFYSRSSLYPLDHLKQLNQQLEAYEREWYPFFTVFLQIIPPSLDTIYTWRIEAESKAREKGMTAMTDDEVVSFVDRFMPSYELFGAGVRSPKAPWHGSSLAVVIDEQRRPVRYEEF